MMELDKIKVKIRIAKSGGDEPFLSIITRCYERPNYLFVSKSTLACQTDQDYEHILLIDTIGQGVEGANAFFEKTKTVPQGKYIFMLDDDNFLCYENFIKDIKQIATENDADIIFFKKKQVIVYPTAESWRKAPVENHIDTSCFCVKRELYLDNIHEFNVRIKGDYAFISKVYPKAKSIYWYDKITNMAHRVSHGKKEDQI